MIKHIMDEACRILLIEPFCAGSHKQLIDLLHKEIPGTQLHSLPGKKWHWKARTSALWFSQVIPRDHNFRTLFASSVLNLAELVAIRQDLAVLHKVVYFHENQMIYPVRKQQDRDFQFGYNEILTCMVADVVLFNSKYNMDSFLSNINSHLKLIRDHRPKTLVEQITPKCHVLHFPIIFPETMNKSATNKSIRKDSNTCTSNTQLFGCNIKNENTETKLNIDKSFKKTGNKREKEFTECCQKILVENSDFGKESSCSETLSQNSRTRGDILVGNDHLTLTDCAVDADGSDTVDETPLKKSKTTVQTEPLHIVWPHRWEHDKDPEMFFKVLTQLHNDGLDFRISVLGEMYSEVPEIFEESKVILQEKIANWGFLPSKQDYYLVLQSADCVVSTAKHEFFGVAMLEAVHLGCYPLCPNQLVYPEIFPKECLYNTEQQLYKKLREFCKKPFIPRCRSVVIDTNQFSWEILREQFLKYLVV